MSDMNHVTWQGMFETPLLSQVINKVYFSDGKKLEGIAFFGTDSEVPLSVIALVLTANWESYCRDKMNQPQIALEFRQRLYAQGRRSAGIMDEKSSTATSTEEDIFTAADFAANYYTPSPDAPDIT
ncbi:hypothetical protein EDD85DRAFT_955080 [Armillaria nabsnona]|nr:hypothetical protein EDD85DRAFT_955080 [Armillaria nabsnona]